MERSKGKKEKKWENEMKEGRKQGMKKGRKYKRKEGIQGEIKEEDGVKKGGKMVKIGNYDMPTNKRDMKGKILHQFSELHINHMSGVDPDNFERGGGAAILITL